MEFAALAERFGVPLHIDNTEDAIDYILWKQSLEVAPRPPGKVTGQLHDITTMQRLLKNAREEGTNISIRPVEFADENVLVIDPDGKAISATIPPDELGYDTPFLYHPELLGNAVGDYTSKLDDGWIRVRPWKQMTSSEGTAMASFNIEVTKFDKSIVQRLTTYFEGLSASTFKKIDDDPIVFFDIRPGSAGLRPVSLQTHLSTLRTHRALNKLGGLIDEVRKMNEGGVWTVDVTEQVSRGNFKVQGLAVGKGEGSIRGDS